MRRSDPGSNGLSSGAQVAPKHLPFDFSRGVFNLSALARIASRFP